MAANRRDKTVSPNQPCDLPEALRHLAFWLGVSGELSNRFGSPSPKTPGNAIVWSIIDRSADFRQSSERSRDRGSIMFKNILVAMPARSSL
jgi:hypothetical protein